MRKNKEERGWNRLSLLLLRYSMRARWLLTRRALESNAQSARSSSSFRPTSGLPCRSVSFAETNGISTTREGSTDRPIGCGCKQRKLRLTLCQEPESPTQGQPALITVRMKADEQERFGFNVKGGADQHLPVLVSRVAPNTPADTAIPKLNEGDEVMSVNGKPLEGLSHDEVVSLIRSSKDRAPGGQLELEIRPNVYTRNVNNESNEEEPPFQYIPVDASPASRSRVKGDRLHQSIMLLHECLETGAIVAQFDQLYRKRSGESMGVSRLPDNLVKNRYRDISPYDVTRVVLKEGSCGDYINASFMEIPSSGVVNRYIATQGPLPNTCDQFWEMLWEQKCSLVVMVTPLLERGRIKCHQYWPELKEEAMYGNYVKVHCSSEKECQSLIERDFKLMNTKTNEEREVTHLQYLSWPDHGVPENSVDFLDLVSRVRLFRSTSRQPVVVHCSAGIGRTGVLILMETAMCFIEANEPIYPLEMVKAMRDQRAMLIQTSGQFRFVCEAVYRIYKEGVVKPLKEFKKQNP